MPGIARLHTSNWCETMGFKNIAEFFYSFVGIWYKELILVTCGIQAVAWYGVDTVFYQIEEKIYSPAASFLVAMSCILFDWAIAVYCAVKNKRFETNKAKRLFPMLIITGVFLSLIFYIERQVVSPMEMPLLYGSFHAMRLFIVFYLCGVHLVSAAATAGRNELMNNKVVTFISVYVDAKKKEFEIKHTKTKTEQ